jgi:hypothetical protein
LVLLCGKEWLHGLKHGLEWRELWLILLLVREVLLLLLGLLEGCCRRRG